jgi:hypothetical protein
MTPESVINDLIYVERYHRTHGAPLTAEIMTRARALIHQQLMALGCLPIPKGHAVMTIMVADYERVHTALLEAHRALVAVYDRPKDAESRMKVYEALGVCREAIYKPPKPSDNSPQSVA